MGLAYCTGPLGSLRVMTQKGMSLRIIASGVALLALVPIVTIFGHLFVPSDGVWDHLVRTVLGTYVTNSLLLMAGVGILVTLLGVGTAWLTSMCDFPGRSLFEWALLLPLALPAYIIAYTYTGLLDFAGPVQTLIRDITGLGYRQYWFPEIRSLGGAIAMFSLVLYPYVYLLTRAAFLNQSICVLDVSRTFGNSPLRTFARVAVPLARPAIIAGLALALMETLADYGTVQYFGVSTFTTGIFRTWYGLDSAVGAAQLSSILLVFVIVLLAIERLSRQGAKYHATSERHQDIQRIRLAGAGALFASLFCILPLLLGFLIPAVQLGIWTAQYASTHLDARFFDLVINSVTVSMLAAILTVVLAMVIAYALRREKSHLWKMAYRTSTLGYAVPGTVIAIGIIIPFAWLDNSVDTVMRDTFDVSTGLILSGTTAALIFAYIIRFLAAAFQSVDSGFTRIKPTIDEAARSMGAGSRVIMRRIHLPMLKGSLLTAGLIVFVDVMKELPATLILRPFNFNTLAVRAYELASDERLAEAAPASLMIVLVGLIPVVILSRAITRSRTVKKEND